MWAEQINECVIAHGRPLSYAGGRDMIHSHEAPPPPTGPNQSFTPRRPMSTTRGMHRQKRPLSVNSAPAISVSISPAF